MLATPTISSIEIAELLETRHDHMRQTIERLVADGDISGVTLSTLVEPNSRGADRITRVYKVPTKDAYMIPKRKHPAPLRIAFVRRLQSIEYEASQTPEALAYAEAMRSVQELVCKPAPTIEQLRKELAEVEDEAPAPRRARRAVVEDDDEWMPRRCMLRAVE
jgi:phage regulator Rha-like protein